MVGCYKRYDIRLLVLQLSSSYLRQSLCSKKSSAPIGTARPYRYRVSHTAVRATNGGGAPNSSKTQMGLGCRAVVRQIVSVRGRGGTSRSELPLDAAQRALREDQLRLEVRVKVVVVRLRLALAAPADDPR